MRNAENRIVAQRELVLLLLSYGIDLNATDLSGKSALMHATASGNHSLASYLIECGAYPPSRVRGDKM
jgi:ankyrin repeat protein